MYFQYRNGWQCQFLEADLKTALPRKLCFTSSDKVAELVERGGGITDSESPVDPRWGVRNEAALKRRTREICFAEIERC
jgi:hypothetical protein